jgi:hypothetical protein
VDLPAPVLARDAVLQLARHLLDTQPGGEDVDGQADLHPPARSEGTGGLEGLGCQAAHPRQGLLGRPTGEALDAVACQAHDEAVPTPGGGLGRQRRDRHVGTALEDGRQQDVQVAGRLLQVAVDEEQVARRVRVERVDALELTQVAHPGLERGGLAEVLGVDDDVGTGRVGHGSGGVGAAVVDDDDPVDTLQAQDGPHRRGDAVGLVLAGDDRGDRPHVLDRTHLHQRRVTWRLSRPERARRSSALSGSVAASAAA